ncbi:MAG: hypothetical protein J6A21_09515 [Lentisphaeria bacterium]|nr:hypothetical protein [Lentisphaeria bacterium]
MWFAIPALIVVGFSWSLTGVVMSDAPRKNCNTAFLMLLNALVSIAASLCVWVFAQKAPLSLRGVLLPGGSCFLASFINYFGLQIMSYSMQKGPNGVIWSFIQSALIFPFLTGVIFFGNELTFRRGTGLVMVLIALACLGLGKENKEKEKGWLLPAFLSFFLSGLVLTFNGLPSYFEEGKLLHSAGRTFFSGCGAFCAGFFWCLVRFRKEFFPLGLSEVKKGTSWKYIFMLNCFGLICSYLLLYPGLDSMADAGAGCVSYPLIVGSCIVGFNLYSLFVLKEKWTFLQCLGNVLCITGEFLIV